MTAGKTQSPGKAGYPFAGIQSGFRLAFTQLSEPVTAWKEMDKGGWLWAAIIVQALLYFGGGLLSARPMASLMEQSGITTKSLAAGQFAMVIGRIALYVLVANFVWALVIRFSLLLASIRLSISKVFKWIAYSTIPFAAGYFFGSLQFMLLMPGTDSQALILSWMLRPFSLGLATVTPGAFPPLSLQWFVVAFLDVFGIWSAVLLLIGARHYLKLSRAQVIWCGCILLLLFTMAIVMVWQIIQSMALFAR